MSRPWARVVRTVVLSLVLAGPAMAAGVDIAWDGCLGDAEAVSLKAFACDRNTGEDLLYVSFVPAVSFAGATILEIAIDLRTRGGSPMPVWWDVATSGGCRRDQFGADGVQPSLTATCTGWSPAPDFVTSRFNFAYPTPDAARIVVSTHASLSVVAGIHYLGCRFLLRHPATVGATACAGCSEPVDITVSALRLANLTAEQVLTVPQSKNVALWQQDRPVSTRATTWGALKSLYR